MHIIDSHQHFWQVGRFDYPWMSPAMEVLYRDYLPQTFEPTLQMNGVAQTILVQASNSLAETRWLLELADHHKFIAGVVGWVDLRSPDVAEQLDEFTAHPKFTGARHLVESEPDDDWLVHPDTLRGLRQLAAYDVPYDLLVYTRHLHHVPRLAESCPDLRLVVDHLAKPPIASREIETWAAALKPVAAYPQIHCKLSGLVTEADHANWQREDLRPYVERALEWFGSERLMFGSDYPVCLLAASYEEVLASFQHLLAELSTAERERIFGGNAAQVYQVGSRE